MLSPFVSFFLSHTTGWKESQSEEVIEKRLTEENQSDRSERVIEESVIGERYRQIPDGC